MQAYFKWWPQMYMRKWDFSLFCPYPAVSTIMATLLPLKTNI